ncbi:MAG: RNA polymerase sigma factor [Bacteroidota bacterium]
MSVYSIHSDEKLLEAIRHSDEEAFSELFHRHWQKLFAAVHARVRSKVIAEEIVQELFVTLWDKRKTQLITNLPHYLLVSAKHRVINHIRSQVVQQKYWDYYKKFIPQREEVTEKAVSYQELMSAIEKGMERLPEKSKKVFQLNRIEGRSISEVANLLKLSEKAIEYHLTRSLKELRLYLKDFILSIFVLLSLW